MAEVWKSRGYLPHLEIPGATQFLTWRLHDAIDPPLWEVWRKMYDGDESARQIWREAEKHLDLHGGNAYFRRPELAHRVMEAIFSHHGEDYEIHAAVVMQNHVHLVVTLLEDVQLSKFVGQIKGGSSHEINQVLGRTGPLWQSGYFDRLIRNSGHLARCIKYVHWNLVKAKLAAHSSWYAHSTASSNWADKIRSQESGTAEG
jgi:REP element-mobilizing transposase RayT